MARLPRAPSRTWLSKTLLFLLLVTLATGVPRVKNSLGASLTIVDVHAHFLPDRDLTFDDAVASAIKHMDQYGVARTIMMSPPRGRSSRS